MWNTLTLTLSPTGFSMSSMSTTVASPASSWGWTLSGAPTLPGANPVATLQLCVGRRCLIYQIQHSREIPQALRDFLSDSRYTFVGVGVGQDLEKLKSDYGIGGDAYCVELGKVAAEQYDDEELKNRGLKALGKIAMGVEMEKPKKVTLSRWDNRRLSLKQVQYATLDAFVSFEVGRILNAYDYRSV